MDTSTKKNTGTDGNGTDWTALVNLLGPAGETNIGLVSRVWGGCPVTTPHVTLPYPRKRGRTGTDG